METATHLSSLMLSDLASSCYRCHISNVNIPLCLKLVEGESVEVGEGGLSLSALSTNKGTSSKRKYYGNSIDEMQENAGLEHPNKRLVIQGQMPPENCPWNLQKQNYASFGLTTIGGRAEADEFMVQHPNNRKIIQGLMVPQNCPWNLQKQNSSCAGIATIRSTGKADKFMVQHPNNKVVIQCLMAPKNCPWNLQEQNYSGFGLTTIECRGKADEGLVQQCHNRVVIQCLMAPQNCPWYLQKQSNNSSFGLTPIEGRGKTEQFLVQHPNKRGVVIQGLMAPRNCPWNLQKQNYSSFGLTTIEGRGKADESMVQHVVSTLPKDRIIFQGLMAPQKCPWNLRNGHRMVLDLMGIREGLCVKDISNGEEAMPISAYNTVDSEKPPPFKYIITMKYPSWCNVRPSEGCHCIGRCPDSVECPCVLKNGTEIPFNYDGAIIQAEPLVYECGPYCKCHASCPNRVSQHGIIYQLEIFKTKSRGWGVRSPDFIPSGSFICEYTGELLTDDEAEMRTGHDEYLFDIGQNYHYPAEKDNEPGSTEFPSAHELQCASSSESGTGFAIDAAHFGNVGRFINHSCSPNIYPQNVLYDHNDKRIPHIMFFAAKNIHPLQELAFDYNYKLDQIKDSNGNIKKKDCLCGSRKCRRRMY